MNRNAEEKKPISCRLEPKFNEALEGRAVELKMTKSDLVRSYVMAGLPSSPPPSSTKPSCGWAARLPRPFN